MGNAAPAPPARIPAPQIDVRRRRRSHFAREEGLTAALLLLPAVAVLVLVIVYPLVQTLLLSFKDANILDLSGAQYIGLDNFQRLVHDSVFWVAVKNTLLYVGTSVVLGLVFGLILALLLNESIPFRGLFRSLALIPWVVPGVVVALLFLYSFNSQVGVIDYGLSKLGVSRGFIDWYGSVSNAMWAEIIANVWNQTPFYMLMILAGLQTVPKEQYEAAQIDGASRLMSFRHVTIPHIRQVLLVVTCLMVIWNFNNFDLIWATTQGGPINATMTLSIYVYRTAFTGLDIGYAAAIGLVWLAALLLFSVIYIRVLQGRDAG
jgi:multiple sugar transport system permease protein